MVRVAAKTQCVTFTARTEVSLVRIRCRKSQGVGNVNESSGGEMSATPKQLVFLGSRPIVAIISSIHSSLVLFG